MGDEGEEFNLPLWLRSRADAAEIFAREVLGKVRSGIFEFLQLRFFFFAPFLEYSW